MAAVHPERIAQTTFGEWADSLYKHLRAKLGSAQDAEDIAQEACVQLLQAHDKAREIRNPRAYLYQIAHHLLYRHYSARVRRAECPDADIETLCCPERDVEEQTADALRRQQINRVVAELSPKCQQALRLRWCEGLQVAEIAERMNLSRAMVKKYLATGLAHCRKRLQRFVVADRVEEAPDATSR